jgi:hypothetical protein
MVIRLLKPALSTFTSQWDYTTMLDKPYYAGVGARDTPADVLLLMEQIAIELKDMGYVLRSGHADGADKAFEKGSDGQNQIWVPWKRFAYEDEGIDDGFVKTGHYVIQDNWVADKIAEANHPNWKACDQAARKLLTRNVYQVLGPGLGITYHETLSKFVVCWTKDGKASGGTGQAIRIAEKYKIPVFNLQHSDAMERLASLLGNL